MDAAIDWPPAVIGQRSVTGDWPLPSQKKAQSGGRITRCKAQPVDLLFSSKLSISRSASTFSLVGVDNLKSRTLGEATFRHQDGTAMKASGVVRQVQPQVALLKKIFSNLEQENSSFQTHPTVH